MDSFERKCRNLAEGWGGRTSHERVVSGGFTLVELMAAVAILILLSSVALPLMRLEVQRARETELRRDLREMRSAIDRYKQLADLHFIAHEGDPSNYPPNLETLVEGVRHSDFKFKFLRSIPLDPMTGTKDWGLRSIQDDPDSHGWSGGNVFDVYTKSDKTALDGTKYSDW